MLIDESEELACKNTRRRAAHLLRLAEGIRKHFQSEVTRNLQHSREMNHGFSKQKILKVTEQVQFYHSAAVLTQMSSS